MDLWDSSTIQRPLDHRQLLQASAGFDGAEQLADVDLWRKLPPELGRGHAAELGCDTIQAVQ